MIRECLIFVLAAFLVTEAHVEVKEVFAASDSQVVLPCPCSHSSHSMPSIIWRKEHKGTVWRKEKSGLQFWGSSWTQRGNQRLRCHQSKFGKGDCSLQINDVREEDGGLYVCTVNGGHWSVEHVVKLRVIKVSFYPAAPVAGNNVSISCNVTPQPSGAVVQWELNDSPIVSPTAISSDIKTAKYVLIEKANETLIGKWTCVVGHRGEEGRASASLSVKGIIQPSRDTTKVYAALGSAVTLPCVFSPGSNPSEPLWQKLQPGSLVEPAPGPLRSSFSSPSFDASCDKSISLREVEFEDEGSYRCSATVEGQRLGRNVQLVVAKITSIPSKRRASVMLTCQLTDTSEVSDYEWVHVTYDPHGIKSVGSIRKGKTQSISTSEENLGEWVCRFTGKDGMLGNVTYQVHQMGGLSEERTSGLSPNMSAVVALSVLLLVLLLILAQLYRNHQRKKRIFQYPGLETIIHTVHNNHEKRAASQLEK